MATNPIKPNPVAYSKEKYTYNTFLDAQADKTLKTGDMVRTYGYAEKNDGLGGIYEVVVAGSLIKVPQYSIEPKSIRNTTETSIKDFIQNNTNGIFTSSMVLGSWTDLPPTYNGSGFTLITTGNVNQCTGTLIETAKDGRTYQISYGYTSNPNNRWSEWNKIVYDTDKIMMLRDSIRTKEEADSLFTDILFRNMLSGIWWINGFNTCFPNTINPAPYDFGFLETYSLGTYAYQIYRPHVLDNSSLQPVLMRKGSQNTTTNMVNWLDWSYENQQVKSDTTQTGDYWIKFVDGTLIQSQSLEIIKDTTGSQSFVRTFPISFVDINYKVYISIDSNKGSWANLDFGATKSTNANFYINTYKQELPEANSRTYTFNILSIGRWK